MTQDYLERAHKLQAEAAAVGFDWPTVEGMLDKIYEELSELRAALITDSTGSAVREELGDILFVLVNLARRLDLPLQAVLAEACDKFERRFGYIRSTLAARGLRPEDADLHVLESLWLEAKQRERR